MSEEATPVIDWAKYGFTEMPEWKGIYVRPEFPLALNLDGDFLRVSIGWEYGDVHKLFPMVLSYDRIPATNQSVVLLLKAFACPKLPE